MKYNLKTDEQMNRMNSYRIGKSGHAGLHHHPDSSIS
jgi:hypothetical protein